MSHFWRKNPKHKGTDIAAIISTLDGYTRTVLNFVKCMPIDRLRLGNELETRLARDGIAAWYL